MGADDIKVFAENEKDIETLIQTMRIYNQDIGIEFDIKKCHMPVMKGVQIVAGTEWQNKVCIRAHGEKETYRSLGTLKTWVDKGKN